MCFVSREFYRVLQSIDYSEFGKVLNALSWIRRLYVSLQRREILYTEGRILDLMYGLDSVATEITFLCLAIGAAGVGR